MRRLQPAKTNDLQEPSAGCLPPLRYQSLLLAGLASLCLFLVYKELYPQPDFYPESYKYVTAAQEHLAVYFRPAGYTGLLRLIHLLTPSANAVAWVQYLLLSGASLLLFSAADRLFGFRSPWLRILSLWIAIGNPLWPVLANQIGCDAFFTALVIGWFACALQVLARAGWKAMAGLLCCMVLLLLTRDHAQHFIVLTAVACLCPAAAGWRYKITGPGLTVLLAGGVILAVRAQHQRATGQAVFSGLQGWQVANNALYIYPYVAGRQATEDRQLQVIDSLSARYFRTLTASQRSRFAAAGAGNDFLWDNNAPLKQYLALYMRDHRMDYLASWYQVSAPFRAFGRRLILAHPGIYARRFVLPNGKNFCYPNPESLAGYHVFHEPVPEETVAYFHLDRAAVREMPADTIQHGLVAGYRVLHALALLFGLLVAAVSLRMRRAGGADRRVIFFWLAFLLVSIGYSTMTEFVVLRHEACWLALTMALPLLLLDRLISDKNLCR